MGCLYLGSRQLHVVGVCFCAGVLRVSSKLGSSRWTLTAHVETGTPPNDAYFNILEGFFNPQARRRLATESLLHGALHLALGGLAGDLAPLVVELFAAGDGELELYVAVLGVEP